MKEFEKRSLKCFHFGKPEAQTTVFLSGDKSQYDKYGEDLGYFWNEGQGSVEEFLESAKKFGLNCCSHVWRDFPTEILNPTTTWRCEYYTVPFEWRSLLYAGCEALESKDIEKLKFISEGLDIIGCSNLATLFTKLGNDVNFRLEDGTTPLIHACADNDNASYRVARALIRAGADVNLQDSEGKTALMHAVQNGQKTMAMLLFAKKADIDIQDSEGRTALMYAVTGKNQCNFVKMILAAGAKVNIHDINGRTALMYALELGLSAVVSLLLRGNADPNIGIVGNAERQGVLPINVAHLNGDNDMVKLLSDSIEERCNRKLRNEFNYRLDSFTGKRRPTLFEEELLGYRSEVQPIK